MLRRALVAVPLSLALLLTAAPATAHTGSPRDVRSSAYTGKFYSPRYEAVRKCIVHRESRGHYGVVNRYSGAAGAYQVMGPLRRYGAKKMGKPWLAGTPVNRWSRADQDRFFWTVWDHGRGRSHWYSRSKPCW
jgi:hypothetical protein